MLKRPKMYDVTYRTDSLSLPTIISAMEGSGTLVSVREVLTDQQPVPRAFVARTKKSGGPDGITLMRQLLAAAGSRGMSPEEASEAFVTHGHAGGSAKSRLSELTRAGSVARIADRYYLKPTAAQDSVLRAVSGISTKGGAS